VSLFAISSTVKCDRVCAPHSAFNGVYTTAAAAANADDNNKDYRLQIRDALTLVMRQFCIDYCVQLLFVFCPVFVY